eukprot:SAG11_NODE_1383_length_5074_cov_41.695276_8_plen_73_part_01
MHHHASVNDDTDDPEKSTADSLDDPEPQPQPEPEPEPEPDSPLNAKGEGKPRGGAFALLGTLRSLCGGLRHY